MKTLMFGRENRFKKSTPIASLFQHPSYYIDIDDDNENYRDDWLEKARQLRIRRWKKIKQLRV